MSRLNKSAVKRAIITALSFWVATCAPMWARQLTVLYGVYVAGLILSDDKISNRWFMAVLNFIFGLGLAVCQECIWPLKIIIMAPIVIESVLFVKGLSKGLTYGDLVENPENLFQ